MPIKEGKEKRDLTLQQLRERTNKRGQIKDFDAVLSVLKDCFACEYTEEEASHESGISTETIQRWRRECGEFDEIIRRSSDEVQRLAKRANRKFVKDVDKQHVQWYMEHGKLKKEYSARIEATGPEGSAMEVTLTKFQKDDLKDKTDEELQRLVAEQVRREAALRGRS